MRRVRFSAESGAALTLARTLNWLGVVLWDKRDLHGAEENLREAIRLLKPIQDRGTMVESQRLLAQVLLDQGRLEEAERFALESRETVGAGDVVIALDDTACARARPGRPGTGRRGRAAPAGGGGDPAADRFPRVIRSRRSKHSQNSSTPATATTRRSRWRRRSPRCSGLAGGRCRSAETRWWPASAGRRSRERIMWVAG